jgi:hypothetical protein
MNRALGLLCVCVVTGLAGCTGSSIEQGVPANAGYVPLPQPQMAKLKGKPIMGATEKERKDALAKESAAPAPAPAAATP